MLRGKWVVFSRYATVDWMHRLAKADAEQPLVAPMLVANRLSPRNARAYYGRERSIFLLMQDKQYSPTSPPSHYALSIYAVIRAKAGIYRKQSDIMQELAGGVGNKQDVAVKVCVLICLFFLGTGSRHRLVLPGGSPRPVEFIQTGF